MHYNQSFWLIFAICVIALLWLTLSLVLIYRGHFRGMMLLGALLLIGIPVGMIIASDAFPLIFAQGWVYVASQF